MPAAATKSAQDMRGCPFCGKPIRLDAMQCPFCREAIQQVRVRAREHSPEARAMVRRGLMYVLLGAIAHYFAAGYSGLTLPVVIPPVVTTYGTPLILACGFGLIAYGAFLYLRS